MKKLGVKFSKKNEQAAEFLNEAILLCGKHKCVLLPGNGVFYLARIPKELTAAEAQIAIMTGQKQKAIGIATIREINPGMAEWAPTIEEEVN
jgi:hypothetical protein